MTYRTDVVLSTMVIFTDSVISLGMTKLSPITDATAYLI